MAARKETNFIAVHCSATRPTMDVGVKEIRKWHKAKGWADIGYHFVIRRNGRVEDGRAVDQIGAHVEGFNAVSVGICMVGGVKDDDFTKPENNFTPAQFASLEKLCRAMKEKYPHAIVQGHRDFPNVAKACPSFDAKGWAIEHGLSPENA